MIVNKKYVFVVCGAASHIQTLHFSLQMLKTFTTLEILVVTDSRRNDLPIQHNIIVDVTTPENLTHHQAAIYLKTKLHHILPKGCLYCYLDTDVVAIRPGIDSIFDYYYKPITFCTDHCKIKSFSPNAVNDEFYDDLLNKQQYLSELYFKYQQEEERQKIKAGKHLAIIQELKLQFNQKRPAHAQSLRGKHFTKVLTAKIIYWVLCGTAWLSIFFKKRQVSRNSFQELELERLHRLIFKMPLNFDLFLRDYGYRFDLAAQKWYNLKGELLYEENLVVKRIEAASAFRWDVEAQIWRDEEGNNISYIESDKLLYLIQNKFDVNIQDEQWRHWNGGVFLFDDHAHAFMEQWHHWTLEIFEDVEWKVRDQGTLIATAWKFGLQQHPTLPIIYNLIADFYHPTLTYQGNFLFRIHFSQPEVHPYFLHIYHHWGDDSWQLWRDLEKLQKMMLHI